MRSTNIVFGVLAFALLGSTSAMSQSAPPAVVNFTMVAHQPSLRDATKLDAYTVKLTDSAVVTSFELLCQAGRSKYAGWVRQDEACKVNGSGSVLNKQGKELPRTKYSGGFTVKASENGRTDATKLKVDYLALGGAKADQDTFGGTYVMLPENPSPDALAIRDAVLKQIEGDAGGGSVDIDDRIDAIQLVNARTPSAGLLSDKGCLWSGDMVYSYQTETWLMKLLAKCGEVVQQFKGNLVWTDVENDETHQAVYTLNLAISAGNESDDALFTADSSGDDDLFENVDGIAGTLKMSLSDFVSVKVGNESDDIATNVDATGTFTGTNVPLVTVRSFTTLLALFSRNLHGA